MARINVNTKYDVLQNNRRIRLVDRQNGAVVVDFIAPPDTPSGIGDAMKQAFDAIAPPVEQKEASRATTKTDKSKKSKRKNEWKKEAAEAVEEKEVEEEKNEEV